MKKSNGNSVTGNGNIIFTRYSYLVTLFLIFVFCVLFSAFSFADINFPDAKLYITYPAGDLPEYGMGSTTLGDSAADIIWNPAALTKIEKAEITLNTLYGVNIHSLSNKSFATQDFSANFGGSIPITLEAFLTSDTNDLTLKSRDVIGNYAYIPQDSGVNFTQAMKINDWLHFGIIRKGETATSINLSGNAPITSRLKFSTIGMQLGSAGEGSGVFKIGNDGKITLSYTQGGAPWVATTEALWSGFLTQTSTVPAEIITELKNDFSVKPGLILSGAGKFGGLSIGGSIIPISATATINNSARAFIKDGTPDILYYYPNISMTNQTALLAWVLDPQQYGSKNGYAHTSIRIPAGENFYDIKYQGYYSGSTNRMDLGATYDLGDFMTVGAAYENFNGATLNMQGTGLVSYASTLVNVGSPTTTEAGGINWDLFSQTPATLAGTENWSMEPQKIYKLPQRTRYGVTLKKLFNLSIDYEQQTNPLVLYLEDDNKQSVATSINGLNVIRVGGDLFLLKGSIGFSQMPEVTGNAKAKKDIQNLYTSIPFISRIKMLPISMQIDSDAGLTSMIAISAKGSNEVSVGFNPWGLLPFAAGFFGIETKSGSGFNLWGLISAYQLDTVDYDLNNVVYSYVAMSKKDWEIKYTTNLDIPGTLGSFAGSMNSLGTSTSSFNMNMLKWLYTIGVTYKF